MGKEYGYHCSLNHTTHFLKRSSSPLHHELLREKLPKLWKQIVTYSSKWNRRRRDHYNTPLTAVVRCLYHVDPAARMLSLGGLSHHKNFNTNVDWWIWIWIMQCCKSTDELKGNCPATISVVNVSQLLVAFAEQQRVCGSLVSKNSEWCKNMWMRKDWTKKERKINTLSTHWAGAMSNY